MKEFIDLHNRTVSRDEIQTVIALAKEQNNTEVIYRLSKILNDHPDSKRFNINIINYPQETDSPCWRTPHRRLPRSPRRMRSPKKRLALCRRQSRKSAKT